VELVKSLIDFPLFSRSVVGRLGRKLLLAPVHDGLEHADNKGVCVAQTTSTLLRRRLERRFFLIERRRGWPWRGATDFF